MVNVKTAISCNLFGIGAACTCAGADYYQTRGGMPNQRGCQIIARSLEEWFLERPEQTAGGEQ